MEKIKRIAILPIWVTSRYKKSTLERPFTAVKLALL
jgi:hypothetical protein